MHHSLITKYVGKIAKVLTTIFGGIKSSSLNIHTVSLKLGILYVQFVGKLNEDTDSMVESTYVDKDKYSMVQMLVETRTPWYKWWCEQGQHGMNNDEDKDIMV